MRVVKTLRAAALLAAALPIGEAAAGDLQDSCAFKECPAGSQTITYATKNDRFYACPTAELAEYVWFVVGMVSVQISLGATPNISPTTGEPEWGGDTALMASKFRSAAGVSTFDQGMALCAEGKGRQKVTVANNPKDHVVIWVYSAVSKSMYWMPKSSLEPRK
jgi:hypothetical protein